MEIFCNNHNADCNDDMALTTEQFMEKYDMTVDELLMLFLPRERFKWDPDKNRFVYINIEENADDIFEQLYEEDREQERETELRNARIELEKRFGPFEHRNRTMNPEVKRMIEEIESFFPSEKE